MSIGSTEEAYGVVRPLSGAEHSGNIARPRPASRGTGPVGPDGKRVCVCHKATNNNHLHDPLTSDYPITSLFPNGNLSDRSGDPRRCRRCRAVGLSDAAAALRFRFLTDAHYVRPFTSSDIP